MGYVVWCFVFVFVGVWYVVVVLWLYVVEERGGGMVHRACMHWFAMGLLTPACLPACLPGLLCFHASGEVGYLDIGSFYSIDT